MIEVRRVAEGDPMDFEVVIREGEGETRHQRDDVATHVRPAGSRQAYAGTLSRGGLPLLARPRADAGVVTGFTGITARIDEVNADSISFKGTTINASRYNSGVSSG
jgi:hypothetical protein